jgi:molybdopterin-guanine dinucleotide biosynthesis protein A
MPCGTWFVVPVHMPKLDEKFVQRIIRNPRGNKPLTTHACRWEDNIKMTLKKICFNVWTTFNLPCYSAYCLTTRQAGTKASE